MAEQQTEFVPTQEQEIIKSASLVHDVLTIDAGAGTGKTATLSLVSEGLPQRSLLLVFGRSNKEDAETRFPAHVEVRTTHSLAYGVTGRQYQDKLMRPRGGYVNVAGTGAEIGRYFSLNNICVDEDEDKWVSPSKQGIMIRTTVQLFEQSADFNLAKKHVPKQAKELEIDNHIFEYAKKLWKERVDLSSKVLISHDTYMKLFQLSKPKLDYDIIYLDEAQDTSPCTLDIIMRQQGNAKIIVVGDERQAIYGWRGSINAMQVVEGHRLKLTESFRFGQNSSDLANLILGEHKLDSFKGLHTEVASSGLVNRDEEYTILFRTNSALLGVALKLIKRGKKVNLEINSGDLCKQLTDAEHLYNGDFKKVKHDSLLMYSNWKEFKEEAETSPEFGRIIKMVEGGQVGAVVRILNTHRNTKCPDVVLTTAHKSKGREWPQVILGDDFPSNYNDEGDWVGLSIAEANLLYVASTRARERMEYNETVEEFIVNAKKDEPGIPVNTSILQIHANTSTLVIREELDKMFKDSPHELEAFDDWLDNGDGMWDNRYMLGAGGALIDTQNTDSLLHNIDRLLIRSSL